MEKTDEKAAAITLNRIFGFKPGIARALTSRLGSAAAVFKLGREEFRAVFGPGSPYPDSINDDELEKSRERFLYIDHRHRGLGSNSCGPQPEEEYELPAGSFAWEFLLAPDTGR